MPMFKKRKAAKYSSVSVDGTTPVSASIVSEKEISDKKLTRAIKNTSKPRKGSPKGESEAVEAKTPSKSYVIDSRLDESIEVIKSFLNFPKDAEFTVDVMVSKFLQLIKDYVELSNTHHALLRKISDKANRSYSHDSFSESWN